MTSPNARSLDDVMFAITDDDISTHGGGFNGAVTAIDRRLGHAMPDLRDVTRQAVATMIWLDKKRHSLNGYQFTYRHYEAARQFLIGNLTVNPTGTKR